MLKAMFRYPFIAILLIALLGVLWLNHESVSKLVASGSSKQDQPVSNVWLIATISPALGQLRRNMIRTTWQKWYQGPPTTMRFVLASAGDEWTPLLEAENATYGDLIMLSHRIDSKELGMKTKELDFFQWLARSGMSWKYVSKLDDDSYLDATGFYNRFIDPRLRNSQEDHVLIARELWSNSDTKFRFPGGQFYTVSWSLVEALAAGYNDSLVRDDNADLRIGRILFDDEVAFEFVPMDNSVAFDFDENNGDKTAWSHNITEGSLNPHQLKDNAVFLRAARDMQTLSSL
jgi:beta-1,3-galactosyltransferase 1